MTTNSIINTNEYRKVSSQFKKLLGIAFGRFCDYLCSDMHKRVIINLYDLDDYLTSKHKDEYRDDMSMPEFIEFKYGLEAREFIESIPDRTFI
jgi:hypothetical protein